MKTSTFIILIGIITSLFALWKDDIIKKRKKINSNNNKINLEIIEKKRQIKIKLISSFFIIFTFTLSIYQAYLTEISNENELAIRTEKERKDSIEHLYEIRLLQKKVMDDSLSFHMIDSQSKDIIESQKYSILIQKDYVTKTKSFNNYLLNELQNQKQLILPLNIVMDIETDEKFQQITSSDSLLKNFSLAFRINFFDRISFKKSQSQIFIWDSSLLSLKFDDVERWHWFKENDKSHNKIILRIYTKNYGIVINNGKKISSILELKNKILNFYSYTCGLKIRNITLLSGIRGSEQFTKLKLEEIFNKSYNCDFGYWYKILTIEK